MKKLKAVSIKLIILGLLLFGVGIFFKIMNWSDMWQGMISGPVVFAIGLTLFLVTMIKKES